MVTPPWEPPKGFGLTATVSETEKGEIKRAQYEPYCEFFDRCSEGGCDEDGDEDRDSEAMASDAYRNSSRYHYERWKDTVGESSQRATKEYLDEG